MHAADSELEMFGGDPPLTEAGILVVDEDPAFQLGLKTFLKEYVGFEKVYIARNGKEAIDLIEREECIELLTVDYQMPEMDGLELLTYLQENSPRPLSVTMITGFPSEELKKEFASRDSSRLLTRHFLSKPVEFEKLEPVILASCEDLKEAQRIALMGGDTGENAAVGAPATTRGHAELLARLDRLEQRIEEQTALIREGKGGRVTSAFTRFWTDIFALLVAALVLLLLWKGGIVERAGDFFEDQLGKPVPAGAGAAAEGEEESRPRASGEREGAGLGPAENAGEKESPLAPPNSGQPLP